MILTDAGPLVALLDARDSHHAEGVDTLNRLSLELLLTTLPCFTEAMHILGREGGYAYQAGLWNLRVTGQLTLHIPTPAEIDRMAEVMEQYQDTPMDLADASLIATAEILSLRRVFSFDSDFYVYRLADGSALEVIR